jgi:hypothetical protein
MSLPTSLDDDAIVVGRCQPTACRVRKRMAVATLGYLGHMWEI